MVIYLFFNQKCKVYHCGLCTETGTFPFLVFTAHFLIDTGNPLEPDKPGFTKWGGSDVRARDVTGK